jgi:hypothetical protein
MDIGFILSSLTPAAAANRALMINTIIQQHLEEVLAQLEMPTLLAPVLYPSRPVWPKHRERADEAHRYYYYKADACMRKA